MELTLLRGLAVGLEGDIAESNGTTAWDLLHVGPALLSSTPCFPSQFHTESQSPRQVGKWDPSPCCQHPEGGLNQSDSTGGRQAVQVSTPKTTPLTFLPSIPVLSSLVTSIPQETWVLSV